MYNVVKTKVSTFGISELVRDTKFFNKRKVTHFHAVSRSGMFVSITYLVFRIFAGL